ncbi:4'-phosphopantetheinyl transferase superfamily protein [Streptomyces atratus]|jgi:4'-phosphopantetheinyl transferase EntD|uniref:4'-phosphopantetheinyl transferase EntD (Siderophore biosynthesis) n=1 Tax=Streptomyces atratus TaxID=1893 RepID=A0A1K2B835_STRAR|nr:4'-phosphopantetheinyl transferase superfamily protein [Streptomyces atratus]SFX94834.1 4'-phosphopantetheinyl transferase EntD (siderophore biosynthesis) [Streptomyces atratus]
MIEKILPSRVAVAEAFSDLPGAVLLPGEEELTRGFVEKRRKEFATTRHCARRALGSLGIAPVPILKGERGAPLWPENTVGSLTHCTGYRAAVVAHRPDALTVGIDAEEHAPLPGDVHNSIALATEQRRERELRLEHPGIHWDRLLFSAKEAVYKAWFPLTHRWLGFEEADIELRLDGSFTAELLACDLRSAPGTGVPAVPAAFHGRWLSEKGLLLTAIVIEKAPGTQGLCGG